jgi:hypothetical protein
MSRKTKWIVIAVGLTLGLCLLPGIVAIFTNGDKTTAQPTVQPAVTPVTTVMLVPATSTPTATEPKPTSEISAVGTPTASAPTRAESLPKTPTVKTAANLRAGPDTTYPKTGSAAVGQALNIVARNPGGDWYQLATGAWIAAFLVANPPAGVPIITVSPPTPAAAAPTKVVVTPVRAAPAVQVGSSNPVAFTCIDGCAVAPDPSCAIKGNVNSHHEKIYHTLGQRDYNKTDIKPEEGDRWFCTKAEAQAAGFRHAQR